MTAVEKLRAARLVDLSAKLKARAGKPGMSANVAAIEQQIADLKEEASFRDGKTKRFVSVAFAIQNPGITERV